MVCPLKETDCTGRVACLWVAKQVEIAKEIQAATKNEEWTLVDDANQRYDDAIESVEKCRKHMSDDESYSSWESWWESAVKQLGLISAGVVICVGIAAKLRS